MKNGHEPTEEKSSTRQAGIIFSLLADSLFLAEYFQFVLFKIHFCVSAKETILIQPANSNSAPRFRAPLFFNYAFHSMRTCWCSPCSLLHSLALLFGISCSARSLLCSLKKLCSVHMRPRSQELIVCTNKTAQANTLFESKLKESKTQTLTNAKEVARTHAKHAKA